MVWAVATREDPAVVRAWVDTFDVDVPVLLDADGSVTAAYGQTMAFPTAAYPQEWLVGTDGTIEYYANTFEYDALAEIVAAELSP